ncbi:hypothetical protein EQZ20_21240 [Bacillus glycinifermentans]|uniref:Uncharacterized protein n=1 Tax=Bacillus glycinifermentans TaxID=1664069 RepID=A0AAJ4D465_9BACI|nr:hypothetical protein [Bacillus glycinifermentans]QAT67154.1 hypothetical protein EQZ20_21240 [Bacillus glycinifermentans]
MTKTKKYVRIKKATYGSAWYADKIGRVFKVEREGPNYLTRTGPQHLSAILKEDAELIVTEKRPAKVGEKVLILDDFNEPRYMLHDEVPVIDGGDKHGVAVRKLGEWPIFLNNEQYEVIVNNEVKNEEADEMERYDTAVETARDAIEELRLAAYAKGYEDARRDLLAQALVGKGAQERRDEIVEQAKADIENLKYRTFYGELRYLYRSIVCNVEFVINKKKRTVVALLKSVGRGSVKSKGIAKAAPSDCFNVHIGKAIALHRALGIEVPDEYLNAPQPTEVRVGDVVAYRGVYKTIDYATVVADGEPTGGGRAALTSIAVKHAKIIDDSRTEVDE